MRECPIEDTPAFLFELQLHVFPYVTRRDSDSGGENSLKSFFERMFLSEWMDVKNAGADIRRKHLSNYRFFY